MPSGKRTGDRRCGTPLFRFNENGDYVPIRQRRREDDLKISDLKGLAFLIIPILGLVGGYSVMQYQVNAQEKTNASQWIRIGESSKEIVALQIAVSEIKGDMKVVAKEQTALSAGQDRVLEVLEELRKDLARKPGR